MSTKTTPGAVTILMVAAMLTLGDDIHAQKSDKDGVILITQEGADRGGVTSGDTPGFPVTISESGSYRLGSNLVTSDAATNAIELTEGNVVLDLNGFSILGTGFGSGGGVGVKWVGGGSAFGNVKVLNGLIRGMGGAGIVMPPSCRIESMHLLQNAVGIQTAQGCMIVNNNVNINGIGIQTGGGATVIGNTVKNNAGLGMMLGSAGYAHNVVTGNNGGDANPQVTGGIQMGGNVCGSALCP